MISRRTERGGRGWALILAALATAAGAAEGTTRARVIYATADEVYIDAGARAGLAPGDAGTLERAGTTLGRVEVTDVSRTSARLRLVGPFGEAPKPGDGAVIAASFRGETTVSTGDFVPLLAPKPGSKATAPPAPSDFHGAARVRHLFQQGGPEGTDYALSRLELNGGWERMGGSSWSFVVDGQASYRSGPAYQGTLDFEEVRADVYRLAVEGPLGQSGFARVGRFAPAELTSFGFLDGALLQIKTGNWRWGALGGARPVGPERRPATERPTAGIYVGHRGRPRGGARSEGTLGVMADYFKGALDRAALLWDERLQLSARTSLSASAEVDKNVTDSTGLPSTQWTRLNVNGRWTPGRLFSLSAGVDRHESGLPRPSDGATGPSTLTRYLRYWAGAGQSLGAGWRADGDLSIYAASTDETPPLWRAGLTKTGVPGMRGGYLNTNIYNVDGGGIKGLGAQASAGLPMLRGRLYLAPSVRARNAARDGEEKKWKVIDAALRADWRADPLTLFAGVNRVESEPSRATLVETGVEIRW